MAKKLENLKSLIHDQEMFYEYLIELGNDMGDLMELRKHEHFVPGCQSAVWLSYDGSQYTVDADSYMVKAVAGIIVDEAHEMTDPSKLSFNHFKDIAKALTSQRQREMQAIINKIRELHRQRNQ